MTPAERLGRSRVRLPVHHAAGPEVVAEHARGNRLSLDRVILRAA